jgi:hypothetical protein
MLQSKMLAVVIALCTSVAVPAAAAAASRSSMDLTATYDVRAKLFWGAKRLQVRSDARIRNDSGHGIERVVFNLVPAKIGRLRDLEVSVDGTRVSSASVSGQTLRVPLGRTVPDGSVVDIRVSYRAWLRPGTGGHDFLFTSASRIVSAMRWIPWVSRQVRYQTARHGDPFVTVVSPRVRVTLDSDVSMRWATSGRQTSSDGRAKTYLAEDVRDFNFTAARDYRVRTGTALGGRVQIRVYTRTLPSATLLDWARRSLERYSSRIGRYPYPTYVVAESSRGAIAMESPALTWIPAGTASSRLPFLMAHETAHQWFYGVVGNDQTEDPFFDEAMAEMLTRSWLGFRGSRCPTRPLDLSIYEYTASCYYEQVYVQGSNFLNDLRKDMGSKRFWDVVRRFWRANRFENVTTRQLLVAFRNEAGSWVLPRYRKRFPSLF